MPPSHGIMVASGKLVKSIVICWNSDIRIKQETVLPKEREWAMGDAIIEMNVEHRTSNIQRRMKNRVCEIMGDVVTL